MTIPTAHAATWDGEIDTNYNEPLNWDEDVLPSANDAGVLNDGGTGVTDLSGGVSPINAQALNVRAGHVLNIDNDGGALTVNANVNMGRGQAGDGSAINHLAGTFNIGGLDMGGNATAGGISSYNLSGTALLSVSASGARDFDIGGNVNTGDVDTTFAITGDSANVTLNGTPAILRSSAIMSFTLGATGIDAIDTTGNFNLQEGAELIVDGSSYTGGVASIPLFSYGNRVTTNEFTTETITGFTGFDTDIVYSDTGIDLLLTVPGAPAVTSFTADATSINGDDVRTVTLSWETINATSLTLNPGMFNVTGMTEFDVSPSRTQPPTRSSQAMALFRFGRTRDRRDPRD